MLSSAVLKISSFFTNLSSAMIILRNFFLLNHNLMNHIKSCLILFFLILLNLSVKAQLSIELSSKSKTSKEFQYLLLTNEEVNKNDVINESIVDLVQPMLVDSMISKKKQHHKLGPLGWFIHTFGNFNWRAMTMVKEKFVGKMVRHSRSGEEQYTEYDVNFDLHFHLKKYLWRVFEAYDRQATIKRQDVRRSHRTDYTTIPFVRDTNNLDIKDYRLHCELTPPRAFRPQLNYLFYPTIPGGGDVKDHPNFESENIAVGFYGVFCLDCNHSCHPELHPYEWMWWLKAVKDDKSNQKIWNLGLFHESSNRMKNWSVNPMKGMIKIPFAFQLDASQKSIEIKHLVMNEFVEEGLKDFNIPSSFFKNNSKSQIITVTDNSQKLADIEIIHSQPIKTNGLKYWMSEINYDPELKVISGYLNMAVAVKDLYTTQLIFKN
jgi:hypothetical protein